MKKLKVAALTGGKDRPSARFRIRQYSHELSANGIELLEYCPFIPQHIRLPGFLGQMRRRYLFPLAFLQVIANILGRIPAFIGARKANLTIINRSVVPGMEEFVSLLPGPRVLDVDDAIWLTDPRGQKSAARLARKVDAVIAGNEYLATWYRQHNDRVFIIPTAIDTEQYRPLPFSSQRRKPTCTIGWMGTSGNFPNLELVRPTVMKVLKSLPDTRILIVSNSRPNGWEFDGKKILFRKWSAETEVSDLQDIDIGLMPLQDSEWTRGKCSFKMLQYLAVGIPAVVSPVGMNNDILKSADVGYGPGNDAEEWVEALLKLCQDEDLRAHKGIQGRKLVEKKFSVKTVAQRISITIHQEIQLRNKNIVKQ